MSDALLATTTLIPFLGHGHAGAAAWIRMDKAERRRLAMAAARGKGAATLWSLTEAWVRTYTRAGAGISEKTVQGYRVGVQALLAAWTSEDLLHPDPDAAAWYVRHLQQSRLTPGTIGKRLAARGFYATLRWARASLEDPFRDIHTPHDPIPRGRSAGPMMPRRLRPCSSRRAIRATGCWCCWGRMTGYAPARAWSCAGAGPGAAGGPTLRRRRLARQRVDHRQALRWRALACPTPASPQGGWWRSCRTIDTGVAAMLSYVQSRATALAPRAAEQAAPASPASPVVIASRATTLGRPPASLRRPLPGRAAPRVRPRDDRVRSL